MIHPKIRPLLTTLGVLLFMLLPLQEVWADKSPINKTTFRGTAIEGADAVAYFTQGKPVEGSSDFTHEWQSATWRFASAEHRDAFAANPEQYAPQYGGYCAYAVANGYTAGIEPEAWTISGGKLYLNFNLAVREDWLANKDAYIKQGDENWPGVLND